MAKLRLVHRCTECGTAHPKWSGQCGTCGAWNSLVEDVDGEVDGPSVPLLPGAAPQLLGDVDLASGTARSTGVDELDRVLGGGLVAGSVTLVGGEPGIGKSTLLLQLAGSWGGPVLYVSAEESAPQVRTRAERLGAVRPDLWVLAETSLPHIIGAFDQLRPELVIVDSIQTVADPELGSTPGSVVQVRGCAQRLVAEAKARGIAVVLVGHVTKEGGLAGPRTLEHVVDTVLAFEGDRHHALRLLRAAKHRFGATNELGVFEMAGDGLRGVPDASSLFLTDRRTGVAGSAVLPTLEGQRPLMVELQALTNRVTPGSPPRRSAHGVDPSRLALLLAVLERRARQPMFQHEVFVSAVGGVRIVDPGADLALCLAIMSSLSDQPIASDLVVLGEVGLAGEVRQVAHAQRRLSEAARLGFGRAIVPANSPTVDDAITLHRVSTVAEAIAVCGMRGVAGHS
jgi:DNA repair protein RadA/Sms